MARIVIVGAGVGGLCAAHAVAGAGHEPVVLERAAEDAAVGAGLVLWPNAVEALGRLGLGEVVGAAAATARRTVVSSPRGRQLAAIDVVAIARRAGAPMFLIDRAALHRILAAEIPVRFEATVTSVDDGGVGLSDGSAITADAVIGADGINSTVRTAVTATCTVHDTGFTAIRGIAEHPIEDGTAFEVWGRGELVGAAALTGGRSYWFYEAPSAKIEASDPLAALRQERWPDPFGALVAATDPAGLLVNRVRTLPRLNVWGRGTTALLGDAAHAMAPNLGQGAAQAIEDAAALGDALRSQRDLTSALAGYTTARRDRARRVQRESDRMARLALSRTPLLRDLTMRLVPDTLRRKALEDILIS